MHRFGWTTAALALIAFALVAATPAASPNFPARIDLPAGWLAEGVAVGDGHTMYAGNTATGAVYAVDLRTGEGDTVVDPVAGRSALGVFADNLNRIWVAGGGTGKAYVYDASSGDLLQEYTLAPTAPRFINDVYVTNDAAYFTNTSSPVLYKIPLGPGGELGTTFETFVAPPGLNGIEATPDGKTLIVVSITTSKFFAIDAETGAAQEIVLDELVARGDGLILQGRTLYVVENLPSTAFPGLTGEVAVVELSPDLTTGEVVARLNAADEPLVNPATADDFGDQIYVVRRNNAPPGPTRVFWLSRVDKH